VSHRSGSTDGRKDSTVRWACKHVECLRYDNPDNRLALSGVCRSNCRGMIPSRGLSNLGRTAAVGVVDGLRQTSFGR